VAQWILRVFKSWGTRDESRRWVNNYELVTDNAVGLADMDTVANAIATAEKGIHFNLVHFLSATVSTWAADSQPYTGLNFRTIELTGTGAVDPVTPDVLDSNVCCMLKYQADTGRSGRRFYRGVLGEGDVQVGGDGRFVLGASAPMNNGQSRLTAFQTAMAPYIGGGAGNAKVTLIHPTGVGTQRLVTAIKFGAVVINRRNHRYFDRAST
jgi:hypothetical protein